MSHLFSFFSDNETEAIRLIENGVDADVTDKYGRVPMQLAATEGEKKT